LATLLYGSQVSCGFETLNVQAFTAGTTPEDPLACKAQRAAPFILQAIFNVVLYSSVKVFEIVSGSAMQLPRNTLRVYNAAVLLYCVGVPIITLAVALSLDALPSTIGPASVQMSLQATICQVRLSPTAQWLLVYVPFIVTGVFIVVLNCAAYCVVKRIQDKAATYKASSSNDMALEQLMTRLAVLGTLTFCTLIVVIVCASVFTEQLNHFSPAFANYLECLVLHLVCIDCTVWQDLAVPPSSAALGVQLFAESFIVVLFGGFFGAQSAIRLVKEWRATGHQSTSTVATGRRDVQVIGSTLEA